MCRIPRLLIATVPAALLALLGVTPACATWSDQPTDLGMLSLRPALAMTRADVLRDGDGRFLLAMLSQNLGCSERVLAADGTTVSAWGSAGEWPGSGNEHSVAFDGMGGIFHAYTSQSTGSVYLQHVRDGGVQDWGPDSRGRSLGTGSGQSVVADSGGGAWVAWGASGGVRLERFLANGAVAPGWNPVGRLFPGGQFPVLASDGSGGVLLFFKSSFPYRARVTRVLPDTTIAAGWSAAGLDLGPFGGPGGQGLFWKSVLISSGAEHFIAVWPAGDPPGDPAVSLARRFGLDGTTDPAWPAGGLSLRGAVQFGASVQNVPRVLPDGTGGFHFVWADSGTAAPRWSRVLSSGAFAPGFGFAGISPLDAGAVIAPQADARHAHFIAAAVNDGGLAIAWDDSRPGRSKCTRVRWLLADGTADPNAPDTGRVIAGTDSTTDVLGITPDVAGGVWVTWDTSWHDAFPNYWVELLMSHMARTPYVGEVTPPAPAGALALAAPWPNPAHARLEVRCSLPDERPATLALYDVSGRRLRQAVLRGAGARTASFDGLAALPPGVYLLRLAHGGVARSARVVLMR